MDADKLAADSAYRRTAPVKPTNITGWHCSFCKKTYKHETAFMRHLCLPKIKADKLRSTVGQAAYAFYSDWMRLNRRTVPSIDTFSNSRFFNSFYRFAEHVVRLDMAHPDVFVRVMSERDLSPTMWLRDQSYTYYLTELDKGLDPKILVQHSIEFLHKVAEIASVPIDEVFSLLNSNELGELIRKRELTPWLLFCSNVFKKRLMEYDEISRKELLSVISLTYWTTKFEENPKLVDEFRKLAVDIGI